MRSNKLKKIISSTLLLSSMLMIGASIIDQNKTPVYADDWDDYYDDDWDDDHDDYNIFGGNISVAEVITFAGRPAVKIDIPNGLQVRDVDVEREPHDGIEEIIQGNQIIIYGLRPGINYSNLSIKFEDYRGAEHIYNINVFNVGGNNIAKPPTQNPSIPQPPIQTPNFPPVNNGIYGDNIYEGNIGISSQTSFMGRPAIKIAIPQGLKIRDVDVDGEPHDGIEEIVQGNEVVIYGLRNGMTYRNLILTLEDFDGIDHKYTINSFTVGQSGVTQPPIQTPTVPPVNNGIYGDNIYEGSIGISSQISFMGRPAIKIAIPHGLKIKDVDVDGEPHDGIEEIIQGNKVIIYGLRNGMTYRNLILTLEDFNGIDHKYTINSFTVGQPTVTPQPPVQNPVAPKPPINANKGEIQKYLEDIYNNIFGRPGDSGGLQYWLEQLSNGNISLQKFIENLLSEDEFNNIAPEATDKVRGIYEGVFMREPDQEGFNFWVKKFRDKANIYGDQKRALIEIIQEMTNGDEFRQLLGRLGL